MFRKKGVLRNFAKYTWKHLCQGSLFYSLRSVILIGSLTQAFSCEFCQHISKNTFLQKTSGGCSCKSLQLYYHKISPPVFFVNFLKPFGTHFDELLEFSKSSQNTGKRISAKYLSADGVFFILHLKLNKYI